MAEKTKIKFQSSGFKNSLCKARLHRRHPENARLCFWEKLALKTRVRPMLFLFALSVLLGLIIYFTYFSSAFRIQNIVIISNRETINQDISNTALNYINSNNKILGQNNLLWLNEKNLADFLLKNNLKISKVDSILKKFPHTISIQISAREPVFYISDTDSTYYLSSDGFTIKSTDLTNENEKQNLPELTVFPVQIFQSGQKVSWQNDFESILKAKNFFEDKLNSKSILATIDLIAAKYEILLENGIKIITGKDTDYEFLEPRFYMLLSDENLKMGEISYIDLQIANRAYVCKINTPCAKQDTTAESKLINNPEK